MLKKQKRENSRGRSVRKCKVYNLQGHSNAQELEPTSETLAETEEASYAKTKLTGVQKPEGKLLGLLWNRQDDT